MKSVTGELEKARFTGRKFVPNYNNPVTATRRRNSIQLSRQAQTSGADISDVSLDYVKQYIPQIQRYVSMNGERPKKNPISLSIQAAKINEDKAKQIALSSGWSLPQAQLFMDENEASGYDEGSTECDHFIGALLGAIGNVASKGIQKIADKRNAKGKPNKFWNFLAAQTAPMAQATDNSYGLDQPNFGQGLKIFAGDVLNDIRESETESETKSAIKKFLPIAVVVVIAIILITVLITKSGKNK